MEGYRITSRDEIPAWIERAKQEFPHRFRTQSDGDAELAHSAFVLKNLTAAGKLFSLVGGKRYEELKAQWSNGVPKSEKIRLNGKGDHSTNPWAATEGNINPKTGRFTDAAIAKQMSVVRGLGAEKVLPWRRLSAPSSVTSTRPAFRGERHEFSRHRTCEIAGQRTG